MVIVRVEVKDKNDPADTEAAQRVFNGISISGPWVSAVPEVDLLSGFDAAGETLNGANGTYVLATAEPPVGAFWSVTVYDTERGGFLNPNPDDRYHINNTTAVRNEDGTVTFVFKPTCGSGDRNCLAVPEGPFDVFARYYLPDEEIVSGRWTMPRPTLER